MAISYAASNRTPKPPLDGRNWRGKERRLFQFLSGRHYVAVVVDGKVQFYGRSALDQLDRSR